MFVLSFDQEKYCETRFSRVRVLWRHNKPLRSRDEEVSSNEMAGKYKWGWGGLPDENGLFSFCNFAVFFTRTRFNSLSFVICLKWLEICFSNRTDLLLNFWVFIVSKEFQNICFSNRTDLLLNFWEVIVSKELQNICFEVS